MSWQHPHQSQTRGRPVAVNSGVESAHGSDQPNPARPPRDQECAPTRPSRRHHKHRCCLRKPCAVRRQLSTHQPRWDQELTAPPCHDLPSSQQAQLQTGPPGRCLQSVHSCSSHELPSGSWPHARSCHNCNNQPHHGRQNWLRAVQRPTSCPRGIRSRCWCWPRAAGG